MIIVFVLFILYTIACCMDGPDLKPRWKRWLGGRLERLANYYYPINYVCKIRYKTRWKTKEVPVFTPPIEVVTYDIKKIEECYLLQESDLSLAYAHEELAKKRDVPLWMIPRKLTIDGMVEDARERCVMSVIEAAKNFVTVEEDRDSCYPEIIVRGSLFVGKKR